MPRSAIETTFSRADTMVIEDADVHQGQRRAGCESGTIGPSAAGHPLGWLCARITAPAFRRSARRTSSRWVDRGLCQRALEQHRELDQCMLPVEEQHGEGASRSRGARCRVRNSRTRCGASNTTPGRRGSSRAASPAPISSASGHSASSPRTSCGAGRAGPAAAPRPLALTAGAARRARRRRHACGRAGARCAPRAGRRPDDSAPCSRPVCRRPASARPASAPRGQRGRCGVLRASFQGQAWHQGRGPGLRESGGPGSGGQGRERLSAVLPQLFRSSCPSLHRPQTRAGPCSAAGRHRLSAVPQFPQCRSRRPATQGRFMRSLRHLDHLAALASVQVVGPPGHQGRPRFEVGRSVVGGADFVALDVEQLALDHVRVVPAPFATVENSARNPWAECAPGSPCGRVPSSGVFAQRFVRVERRRKTSSPPPLMGSLAPRSAPGPAATRGPCGVFIFIRSLGMRHTAASMSISTSGRRAAHQAEPP